MSVHTEPDYHVGMKLVRSLGAFYSNIDLKLYSTLEVSEEGKLHYFSSEIDDPKTKFVLRSNVDGPMNLTGIFYFKGKTGGSTSSFEQLKEHHFKGKDEDFFSTLKPTSPEHLPRCSKVGGACYYRRFEFTMKNSDPHEIVEVGMGLGRRQGYIPKINFYLGIYDTDNPTKSYALFRSEQELAFNPKGVKRGKYEGSPRTSKKRKPGSVDDSESNDASSNHTNEDDEIISLLSSGDDEGPQYNNTVPSTDHINNESHCVGNVQGDKFDINDVLKGVGKDVINQFERIQQETVSQYNSRHEQTMERLEPLFKVSDMIERQLVCITDQISTALAVQKKEYDERLKALEDKNTLLEGMLEGFFNKRFNAIEEKIVKTPMNRYVEQITQTITGLVSKVQTVVDESETTRDNISNLFVEMQVLKTDTQTLISKTNKLLEKDDESETFFTQRKKVGNHSRVTREESFVTPTKQTHTMYSFNTNNGEVNIQTPNYQTPTISSTLARECTMSHHYGDPSKLMESGRKIPPSVSRKLEESFRADVDDEETNSDNTMASVMPWYH
jgi:hypothetical protein